MGSLQIMLDKGQEDDWFSSDFIVALAIVAAIMLTAFVIRELWIDQPLVRFRLLKYRQFSAGVGMVMALGFVLYGSLVLLPLFMQTLLGWTAETAGLWNSPRGIGTALCMPLVGYLLKKNWDGRWMLAFGFIVASLAFFGYSHMDLQSGTWDIFWYQITQGLGMSFIFVPLTTLTMEPIPKPETGYATSLYSVMRNIGSSMGISFVTTLVERRSQIHQSTLVTHTTEYNDLLRAGLGRLRSLLEERGTNAVVARRDALALLYRTVQRQARLLSFLDAFRILGFLFLVIIPVVFLMRRDVSEGAVVAKP
jgi:DHA2 family multidrug resistance protein